MTCQRARDTFPELLDRRTPATALLDARAHLASCPDCQREFAALSQTLAALDAMPTLAPTPSLRKNFYAMLEEEKHSAESVLAAERRRTGPAAPRGLAFALRWVLAPLAGCALLALGFTLGQRHAAPVTTPTPESARIVATEDPSTKAELVALRQQMAEQREQLTKMTHLVGYSILQQQQNPANERLQGILAKAKDATPSEQDIDILIKALNLDPNTNVRLRALEALYRHAERETVRAGVLAALPREQNPLVQLELIDFVAAAQETNAAPALERMIADDSVDRTVRDAAKLALAQL